MESNSVVSVKLFKTDEEHHVTVSFNGKEYPFVVTITKMTFPELSFIKQICQGYKAGVEQLRHTQRANAQKLICEYLNMDRP